MKSISETVTTVTRRRLTRRDVLKRGSAIGLTIPIVSSLLAACASPDDEEDAVADESVDEVDDEPVEQDDEEEADEETPEAEEPDVELGSELFGELEGPEVVDEMPTAFSEAPELADLVESGDLPPVEERIGSQPMVVRPVHEIGQYGGSWRRAFTGPADHENGNRIMSSDKPLFWDYTGTEIRPSLARDWELSDEGRVTTLYLREGMHWSDGEPFTSADFMWWFEHIYENPALIATKSPETSVNGEQGYLEADGDFVIRFVFPHPYPMFPDVLAGSTQIGGGHATRGRSMMGAYAPGHYLEQFHPDFIGEDEADRLATEAGYDNWVTYFQYLNDWALNVDLPVVGPWKTVSPINEPNWVMERNPYYWAVDTEGNQLPYMDSIIMRNAEDLEVITLRAIGGEIDVQGRHMELPSLPVYLENQDSGDYTVRLDQRLHGGDAIFNFNISFRDDEEIANLFNERDFRRAFSLGIQRDQLNEALWLGLGTEGSCIPASHMPQNPGEEEWRPKWSTFDPDQANELLDGLGLTERDSEGYRLRRDNGERLRLRVTVVSGSLVDAPATGEMVSFQVGEHLGIQLEVQELERSLFWERVAANELQIPVWLNSGSEHLLLWPQHSLPTSVSDSPMGPEHARWWLTGGSEGIEPPEEMKQAYELLESASGLQEESERNEVAQEIWKILVEEQWSVGTIGVSPASLGVRIVRNHMGNIPARQAAGQHTRTPCDAHPPTFYFKS